MVINIGVSKEQRVAQLKACCEIIMDNAEKIINNYDMTMNRQIVIDMKCQQLPTIRVTTEFISEKICTAE